MGFFTNGPPEERGADSGGCFTSKFFLEICRIMLIKNDFRTTSHPQTNEQVEEYNKAILATLRKYVQDHPRDGDLYTDGLTYVYNYQQHTSTNVETFELVI